MREDGGFGEHGLGGEPARAGQGADHEPGGYGRPASHGQPHGFGQPGSGGQPAGPGYGGQAGEGEPAGPGYGGQATWPGFGPVGYARTSRARRRGGVLSHLAVAVAAAALGAGLTVALYRPAAVNMGAPLPGASAVPAPAPSPAAAGRPAHDSLQGVVNKVEPGLVVINTRLQYNSQAAAGTGMVINPRGLVLTNNHVIEDSTKITATVVTTGKTYPARVVGYDKTGDIALIQLEGASGLRTIPIGNSATVRPGAPVVALGNAEGQGTIIPAGGRVTGVGKTITANDQGSSASPETLHGMIQTNANIVPGDSGGPLVSTAGSVIGIDTAGNSVSFTGQAPAAGFAVPINTALAVARQIAAGHASASVTVGYPPFMGVFIGSGSSSSPQVQAQQQQASGSGNGFGGFGGFPGFPGFGGTGPAPRCYTSNASLAVPSSIAPVGRGTLVDGTICGSPAAAAGMTGGSVITAVGGTPVGPPHSLTRILARFHPGDTVSVTWVSPSGHRTTSSLRLVAGPPQ
jgi:S1-C subfamily serine protease